MGVMMEDQVNLELQDLMDSRAPAVSLVLMDTEELLAHKDRQSTDVKAYKDHAAHLDREGQMAMLVKTVTLERMVLLVFPVLEELMVRMASQDLKAEKDQMASPDHRASKDRPERTKRPTWFSSEASLR